jgi:hypothetical protein
MLDTVHMDEKWFFVLPPTVKYYIAPDKDEPHQALKSKQYIIKVMLSVVPLQDQEPTDASMASLVSGPLCRKSLHKEPLGTVQEEHW